MQNQGMIFLNSKGKVQWMTRPCREWIAKYFRHEKFPKNSLPKPLQQWLTCHRTLLKNGNPITAEAPLVIKRRDKQLVVRLAEESKSEVVLSMTEQAIGAQIAGPRTANLTAREREVLHWIAQGKANAEIGMILSLSTRTIEKHAENIFRKLGVENRNAAALSALQIWPQNEP
jgi:DNA-binding CsgD family transcriptional regulator